MITDPRFSRVELLLGTKGLARLRRSFVVVVGLGAVGSYATEALARAGVGRLRLVDFDELKASNVNRQLYALGSTLGRPKCDVARERVLDIQPACQVEALKLFLHTETMDQVLADEPDMVIDAIDSLNPKVELLCALKDRGLNVVSSMGAALRTEPGQVRVGPLSRVGSCPLATRVRRLLRKRASSVDPLCVYSEEEIAPRRRAFSHAAGREDSTLSRGRERPAFGSLPTLTGIFGLTLANEALRILLGGKFPVPD